MEIERKFKITSLLPPQIYECKKSKIEQCYLSFDPEIRARKINTENKTDYYLTIKSNGNLIREEIEIKIDVDEYEQIKEMQKTKLSFINKTRYYGFFKGKQLEVDVYDSFPLITAEVEFDTIQEANNFIPPSWFGTEVTNDVRYKNKNLVRKGMPLI